MWENLSVERPKRKLAALIIATPSIGNSNILCTLGELDPNICLRSIIAGECNANCCFIHLDHAIPDNKVQVVVTLLRLGMYALKQLVKWLGSKTNTFISPPIDHTLINHPIGSTL